jgi:type II secretory pathway component PulF
MPQYAYQAINESGTKVSGTIEADSQDGATRALVNRGLFPTRVTARKKVLDFSQLNALWIRLTRVRPQDLILFTKQFRTLLRGGVPMLTILQALENQTENKTLQKVIVIISQDIREGASLFDAFKRHPHVFSPLYCNMLQAGEASGALPQILDRLIQLIEHEHKIRSDIRAALQYPLIVVGFLVVAFLVLVTIVIPKFAAQFVKSGLMLPWPTRFCLWLYGVISGYWFIVLLVGVAALIALRIYLSTDRGRYRRDLLLIRLPLIGPMVIKAAMSRFASIFSILQASGVTVLESMRIVSETITNHAISKEFQQISDRLEEGRGIAGPLKSAKFFTPIVINLVAIGEEAGNLIEMLSEASQHYDSELEYATKRLSDSIGPLLTLGLAVVVGFFAISVYLPMWNMVQIVH